MPSKKKRSSAARKAGEDLTLQAFNMIKSLLFRNEITPEMRLNARELSKTLDMSPTPVTQALKLLHYQGIICHVPNRGYFMEANTPEQVEDIFNLRLALETASINTILDRIDDGGWEALEKALDRHMAALSKDSPKLVLMADMSFHTTLARISNGPAGERLIKNLFEMLYLKTRSSVLYISPRKQFGEQHREILDHLGRGDTASAREAVSSHIIKVKEAVLKGMAQEEESLDFQW
ncbi:MAG: GntR family transcriptional regulator [Desulfobacterales bacterium]|nr:GntR family transcriptional regulator [Desulfobacterales bacterium]